ncbi:hypothetical protein [Singulisphaera sp. PoT]|uniref:hypothetical protein n=1 Tax=Singulisphaera sp. PoT TaxID=3411797 RepID=UPI003BF5C2C5
MDERGAGRIYNVADRYLVDEAEWVRRIVRAEGWQGRVVTALSGRIPLPYRMSQNISMNSDRIRRELGYVGPVPPGKALERTIAWERANPPASLQGFGLPDYEDELLAELADRPAAEPG